MTTLLLRLAGPLQSWGDRSRHARRDTRPEPSKSGVLGLLAAAEGRRRSEPIEDLAALSFGVRVDQPGRLTRDFQTATRRTGPKPVQMPLSFRYYLADAVFVAAVSGNDTLVERLAEVVAKPAFPLYLGRRACPVEGRLSMGLFDGDTISALRSAEWQAKPWYRRQQPKKVSLRVVADGGTNEPGTVLESVRDVPVSYSPERRDYRWREVVELAPIVVENDAGHDSWDFLAELGG